jgi:hypothetical protein
MIKAQPGEVNGSGVIPAIQFGHMAAPELTAKVDYSTFEHSTEELGKLLTLKKKNKRERKQVYGKDANKHLNIPSRSIGQSVRFTF